jgi:hypothetical protein
MLIAGINPNRSNVRPEKQALVLLANERLENSFAKGLGSVKKLASYESPSGHWTAAVFVLLRSFTNFNSPSLRC